MGGAAETEGSAQRPAPAWLAGVDEAGRGPLAGPVVAAAVILHPGAAFEGLADSKRLSAARRARLATRIEAEAVAWALAWVEPAEVDALNVLQATMTAMARAVAALRPEPARVLVDGDRCPPLPMPAQARVGGDALEPAISAASILAKVARDRHMGELEQRHPGYGFARHKGYGTRAHLDALQRLGPCAAHRRSFAPVRLAARQGVLPLENTGRSEPR